jgi:hypothetical protein
MRSAAALSRRGRRAALLVWLLVTVVHVLGYRSSVLLMVPAVTVVAFAPSSSVQHMGSRPATTFSITKCSSSYFMDNNSNSNLFSRSPVPPGNESTPNGVDDNKGIGGGGGLVVRQSSSPSVSDIAEKFLELCTEIKTWGEAYARETFARTNVHVNTNDHQHQALSSSSSSSSSVVVVVASTSTSTDQLELAMQEQEQANGITGKQETMQLQLDFQNEVAAKDLTQQASAARHLQATQEQASATEQELMTTDSKEFNDDSTTLERMQLERDSRRQQISNLQTALHEREEAMKRNEWQAQELEAELSQLEMDSQNAVKNMEDAHRGEKRAPARGHNAGIRRVQTLGEHNVEHAREVKIHLQRDLQSELAEQDTLYRNKIAEIEAAKAEEIQALQARLDKLSIEYQDYKLTTIDAQEQQHEVAGRRSADENIGTLVQQDMHFQTILNEQKEATKQQPLKAQDVLKKYEALRAAYELERQGRAADQVSAANELKQLKEKARLYVISLQGQGERVRTELTNLLAEKEAVIAKQHAHDRKPSISRLGEDERVNYDLRMRLANKDKELRNAETVVADQRELIADLSANQSNVKALSQQALKLLWRRVGCKVGRIKNRVAASASNRVNKKKRHVAPQTALEDDLDDDLQLDDWLDQDDDFDSEFVDRHDGPKGLASFARSTTKSMTKTLTRPSIVSRATGGLWKQPFVSVQRNRKQVLPQENASPDENRTFKRMVRVTSNGD